METLRRNSKKRSAILECIQSTTCHPTADWIFQQLKPAIPDLSLGTVYRNLNLLAEQGTINRIPVPGGADRYDRNNDGHQHVICRCCGKVVDWPLPKMEEIDNYLREKTGFAVERHDFLAWGLCKDCQK